MPLNISNFAAPQIDAVQVAGSEDEGQAGLYCIPKPYYPTLAGLTAVQNTAYAVRIRPARQVNVQNVAFVVTTASANNPTTDAGIYDATGAALARNGGVAALLNSGTGVKLVPLVFTLTAGKTYYVVLNYGTDAAPGVLAGISTSTGSAASSQLFGSALGALATSPNLPETFTMANTPPLPATVTYTAGSAVPLLVLREF